MIAQIDESGSGAAATIDLAPQIEGGKPATDSAGSRRQADLYWRQMQQLKGACVCMRLYRNRLGLWVRLVDITKAVASSASIGAWVIWKQYPFIWSGVIVAAQVLDAVKGVFPFAKTHKSASELTIALEQIFIDAQYEWERVYTGQLTQKATMEACRKLRVMQLEAEKKHFPEGFAPPKKLISMAEAEANTYFSTNYPADEDAPA